MSEWITEYGSYEQVPQTLFDPEFRVYRTALDLNTGQENKS